VLIDYDSYSLRIIQSHDSIDSTGKASAVCLYKTPEPLGFSCAMQAAVIATSVDTYYSFWLAASYFDRMEELNSVDLLASEFTASAIN
jgi:hypothetical protein